jgi:prepilin-type N-terminal cleavage/methylation domain-containing protein
MAQRLNSASGRHRRGFTLSEMLVVLGILVTVTALAQPALRGALGDSRLRSAAKLVRVELSKARLRAMQSGIAQQFRYQLGKSRFQIVPAVAVEQAELGRKGRQTGRDDVRPARTDRQRVAAANTAAAGGPDELPSQELPDGICFEPAVDEPPAVAPTSEEGWSDPIVFYPNGRTKNAQIRIKGERNTVVDVSLRGLTGVATAGKPRHEEELR